MSSTALGSTASRRHWLGLLSGSAAAFVLLGADARSAAQNPPRPTGNEPAAPGSKDDVEPKLTPPTKAILEANEKDIKKNVEKLFQLASELKAEVDKTDSVQVLSLAMLRKTEEIEKLAKDIRSRAKG